MSKLNEILKYRPAEVKEYKSLGIVAEFYVYDPDASVMVRQRFRLNRQLTTCRNTRERLRAAKEIADDITQRLANGWSPLHESQSPRLCTSIDDVRKIWLKAKQIEGLRDATLQSYASITGIFSRYTLTPGVTKACGYFLREDAIKYMDIVLDKGVSNRAYNNTLKQLHSFFAWAKEHCYCKENPFDGIRLLNKESKKRSLIDEHTRAMIVEYLKIKCPQYLLFLRLIYTSMLRPKEALSIRMSWIDFSRHCFVIPGEYAKNGKTRCAAFTPEIEQELLRHVMADKDWYLFGKGYSMEPCVKPAAQSTPRHKWDVLRRDLNLPKDMQMYSFRDTGIIDMQHSGIDQLTVQHHTDHSSLNVQRIYTDHYDASVNDTIYEKAPSFSTGGQGKN